MGDFDRKSSGNGKNEKNKVMVLALLGAVLLGVGFYHSRSGSPQSAAAAPLGTAIADPGAASSKPEDVINALQFKNSLKGLNLANLGNAGFEATPRNPFQMAHEWKVGLFPPVVNQQTQPEIVKPPVNNGGTKPPDVITVPLKAIPPLKPADYKLSSVMGGAKKFAVINNTLVEVGAQVGDAKVISITEEGVVLRHVEAPADGPTITISNKPRLNGN